MLAKHKPPRIKLPRGWQDCVESAVLYAIALAQGLPRPIGHYSIVYARGWAADTFLVTSATIAVWVKRIDENGPDALLKLREPVNKFPDFVRYIVQRRKTPNPSTTTRDA